MVRLRTDALIFASILQDGRSFCIGPCKTKNSSHFSEIKSLVESKTDPERDPSLSVTSLSNSPRPGDELFPEKGKGYVPLGLTEKKYAKIKKNEKARAAKLNLGMWGPRFKQIGKPGDNWMAQPKLWTKGFVLNTLNSPPALPVEAGSSKSSKEMKDWSSFIQRHYMAFFVVYVVAQVLQVALTQLLAVSTGKVLSPRTLFLPLSTRSLIGHFGDWRVLALKLSTAFFFACPVEIFVLERINRQMLWTRKRSLATLGGSGIVGLIAWGVFLSGIYSMFPKLSLMLA